MSAPQKVELSITTQSQTMPSSPLPAPVLPKITMNGNPIPAPDRKPGYPTGWQVVVIDAIKDMTDPKSILSNQYVGLYTQSGSWSSTYTALYQAMVHQALSAGNIQQQLFIAASFGLDANMPPNNEAYHLLLEYGAGAQLQHWETSVTPGSQSGGSAALVANPVNYILVGYSSDSYGMGDEKFDYPLQKSVQTNLTVTLSNPVPPPAPSS